MLIGKQLFGFINMQENMLENILPVCKTVLKVS
jgi:hypothetical protein